MINLHTHSDYSNVRLLDSTNRIDELIKTASDLNYSGLAITEHELLSSHVKAIETVEEFKKEGKLEENFKLVLGNEIYLVDDPQNTKENYISGETKFPHFILLAKDATGHEQLRRLSSIAWNDNYFRTGIMERVPTGKGDIESIIGENPGHVIASSACLGSELNIYLLQFKQAEEQGDEKTIKNVKLKIDNFIKWCISVFGQENFFIELQPALSDDQKYCNQKLLPIARYYNLKFIITTDAHYLRPEDRDIHRAYLNAKEGEREIDEFYYDCYLKTVDEVKSHMNYLDDSVAEEGIANTLLIGDMIEDFDIRRDSIIPKVDLPEFEVRHLFQPAYEQYPYLKHMAYSNNEQDRYLMKLIEDGFEAYIPRDTLSKEYFHQILNRVNVELEELWGISQHMNQSMPSYYNTVKEIVDVIWDDCKGDSLVGSGRGSSSGFIINFLLGVTQINPLDYEVEIPHWRHLSKMRPDIADVDLDFQGNKRPQIIQALKDHFGSDKVLNICTFGKEGSKSSIITACRGLEIDSDTAQHISGMIPIDRGANWSLSDCLYGNEEKGRQPIKEFIDEIDKRPHLRETCLKIENLINKRSVHAGGFVLYNSHFTNTSAMMRAPNGQPVTQFNLEDEENLGSIKYDGLTIEALDKIRETMDMLIEYGEMEWQGNLRDTFIHYLHPQNLDYESSKLYQLLGEGSVPDLFQFSTAIGHESVVKVKPSNLTEMAATNSLMRLMPDGGEQPVDTFIKHKNNIDLWYKEMKNYNLSEEDIKIMEEHLLKLNGVADSQESIMILTMDSRIANFSVVDSNKLRKTVAKKVEEDIEKMHDHFFEQGRKNGTSENLLRYIWDVQIKRQLGYSFSNNHVIPYSIVAMQELNLNTRFNPLYWKTACLTVNSGGNEDNNEDKSQATEYGKIASAIGDMKVNGVNVALPDINKAHFGFTPDISQNQIVFGLKGINGIGDDIVHEIISHRPYESFEEFIMKMYETNIIQKGQIIKLIKAGCFDELMDRKEAMKKFITQIAETKDKLTMQNLPRAIKLDIIPERYAFQEEVYHFRGFMLKSVYKHIKKPKDKWLVIKDEDADTFFKDNFSEECIVDYDQQGNIIISDNKFKKEYDELMKPLKEWITSEETLTQFNKAILNEEWLKHAQGNLSKWEMDSNSFYYHEHELAKVDKMKYNIFNYFDLPEEPEPVDYLKRNGRDIPIFNLKRIVGTVLDNNKDKHTVTLLTPEGVVMVKLYAGAFSHYSKQLSVYNAELDKKEVVEKSWFTRGNKLMITGFRRGNQFIPRTYKNSIFKHTVVFINNINSDGSLNLTTERQMV